MCGCSPVGAPLTAARAAGGGGAAGAPAPPGSDVAGAKGGGKGGKGKARDGDVGGTSGAAHEGHKPDKAGKGDKPDKAGKAGKAGKGGKGGDTQQKGPSDVAQFKSGCSMMGGGPGSAVAGAAEAAGGGGGDLQSVIASLTQVLEQLKAAVAGMAGASGGGGAGGCGGGKAVAGVQGRAASRGQYVAPAAPASGSGGSEDSKFEQRVLELVNRERAKAGLAPVRYNSLLDNAAEKHAAHMSLVGRMAHDGIGDGTPGERIRAEGFRRAWGENVATGQTTPEQVVREWMNSPTHRRNILDPSFRQLGVGQVVGANGRTWWAQEFGA